jgi:hypothetical protein
MNQIINFFWTIVCFAAVVVYWISAGLSSGFYVFIAISFIPAILSQKTLNKLQLSKNTRFYERLGVRVIRRFVQHGDIANRISRKNKPGYQVITQKSNPAAYLKTIAMYERFHLMCLLFFLFTTVAALLDGRFIIAIMVMISNIIYNFYPILLQQFNRIRILRLTKTM